MQVDATATQPVSPPGVPDGPAPLPPAGWESYAPISGDPVVDAIIVGGGLIVLLTLLGLLGRLRRASRESRMRAELRRHYRFADEQRLGQARLAARITATSSTGVIAGFEVVRQIEAVFTDGHPTPSQAVEALKAIAAAQGANAIINLSTERPPSGKCLARGDAVVVCPIDGERPENEGHGGIGDPGSGIGGGE